MNDEELGDVFTAHPFSPSGTVYINIRTVSCLLLFIFGIAFVSFLSGLGRNLVYNGRTAHEPV